MAKTIGLVFPLEKKPSLAKIEPEKPDKNPASTSKKTKEE